MYGHGSVVFIKSRGLWRARLELGFDDRGKRLRWEAYAKSSSEAGSKLNRARVELATTGTVSKPKQTTGAWLEMWVDEIAKPRIKPTTWDTYRRVISKHLVPRIGKVPLAKLTVAQVRQMHRSVMEESSLGNANNVYRVLRAALSDAEREGAIPRNVAKLVRVPVSRNTREPLTLDQAKVFVTKGTKHRLYSRYLAGLLTGARQGELLGLTWDRVTYGEHPTITLSWQLQELPYRHGCAKRGKGPSCGMRAPGWCPARELDLPHGFEYVHLQGNKCLTRPKSRAGLRVIPIPQMLVEALRKRHRQQIAEPNPHGLVWTQPNGSPLDGRRDLDEWKAVQEGLGLPGVDVHSMRHTTATLLMDLGVPETVLIAIMGQSSIAVARAYQHADLTMARRALDGLSAAVAPLRQSS